MGISTEKSETATAKQASISRLISRRVFGGARGHRLTLALFFVCGGFLTGAIIGYYLLGGVG